MLSYRHSFHAGNFADVHKHLVLSILLEYLIKKDKPLCYIDTHSGIGLYDLQAASAMKNQEFKDGFLKLNSDNPSTPESITAYLNIIKNFNDNGQTRYYPGSPAIAANLLRPQDRIVLSELHNTDYPILKQYFHQDKRVTVHHQNGYQGLKAFLPPKEKRGLVLIDPSYELSDEFDRVQQEASKAYTKWPTGCYAIWYPILLRKTIDVFEQKMIESGIKKILVSEICLHDDDVPKRLNGSGMMLINPPWKTDEILNDIQPWLLKQLHQDDRAKQRVEWLSGER